MKEIRAIQLLPEIQYLQEQIWRARHIEHRWFWARVILGGWMIAILILAARG